VELAPEAASLTVEADKSSFVGCAGVTDVLAGESAADEVNGFEFVSCDLSDVAITFYLRPVFREHLLAERINLDLPAALHASALQAEIHAADACEQRAEGQELIISKKSPRCGVFLDSARREPLR
jgi:hypothetical protein